MNPYRVVHQDCTQIGLIAGWGVYPLVVADALRHRDYDVHCVGIGGHVDQSLATRCRSFREIPLTRLGAHIQFLRRQGVRQAVFAGKIHKVLFFQPGFLRHNLPDWQCLRLFSALYFRQEGPGRQFAVVHGGRGLRAGRD